MRSRGGCFPPQLPRHPAHLLALPDSSRFGRLRRAADVRHPPLLLRDVWLDGIHLFAARERAGSEKGLYVAGKGGHNDESHNHNDVGHFIVYADGVPALIDIGVETYTSKTFSPHRYEIWTMQSAYHALPTVRGIQQAPGSDFQAADVHYAAEEESAEFSLELASAYPAEAELTSWRRTIRLDRPAGGKAAVHVTDSFSLSGEPADVTLSLMTLQEPQLAEGRFTLAVAPGMAVRVAFDADRLAAESERIEVGDDKLRAVWGDRVHRVVLRAKEPVSQEQWRLVITQEHE
ncbi:heparinase II/III-family protein [Paenibacillus sp. CC-CFT747]|nr:heparinase II/III-family protein [Paenibacillus sp. CC-CFT747]